MKKILMFFTILFIAISIGLYSTADMGAPMVNPYTAVISNIDGAEVYKYDKNAETEIIEYGKEVEVMYEYENDEGILYASITKIGDKLVENKDIKLSDITVKNETYVSDKLNKEEPYEFIVLAEGGVEIYKGPAEGYSKTETVIPYGTEVTGYAENDVYESPWFYVTYNNVSGWICQLDAALGTKYDKVGMIFGDVELYDINMEVEDSPIAIIPSGTLFKNYILNDPWSQSFRIAYDGKIGNVYNRDLCSFYGTILNKKVTENGIKMYTEADFDSEVLIENIPVGTVLSAEYVDYYDIWMYTSYNGISGFVNTETLDYLSEEEIPENPELPAIDESKIIDCEGMLLANVVSESDAVEETENQKASLSNMNQIMTICVIAALVLALTCIVIINLVNKKFNNKNEENINKD